MKMNPIFLQRDFFINELSCFALMPFTDDNYLKQIYDHYIKTTVEKCGMSCHRADDAFNNDAIIEDIWKSINEAKLIIAELTGKNPNVFYELGISHTIGKEVIMISQGIEDVPFDLRHLRVITYDSSPSGYALLQNKLEKTINEIIK